MNRLIKCVGTYAKEPYHIRNMKTSIYSIEELCYFLCEYTDLIDRDLMEDELISWLGDQCGLSELAGTLGNIRKHKESLASYVGEILSYTKYIPDDQVIRMKELLQQDEKLSIYERKKKRADNLTSEKKYSYAVDIYLQLLSEIPQQEPELLAQVLFNCGVIYAKLFYYEIAQEFFERTMKLSDDSQVKQAYLFCKRRLLSKEDYLNFNADHPEYYEDSLALERVISELQQQWEVSDQKKELGDLFDKQDEKGHQGDLDKVRDKMKIWEKEFVTMVRLG